MTDDESPTAKWLMEYHPELGTCMLETDNPRKKKGRKYWRQKAGDLDMDLRETGKDLDDCVDELRELKMELRASEAKQLDGYTKAHRLQMKVNETNLAKAYMGAELRRQRDSVITAKKAAAAWKQAAKKYKKFMETAFDELADCEDCKAVYDKAINEIGEAQKDLALHKALLTAEIRGRADDAAKLREILEIARHWYFDGTTPPPQSASEAMGKILGVIEITPVDNDVVKLQKIKRISDYWGNVINDSSTPNSFECMLQIAKVFRGIDDPTI